MNEGDVRLFKAEAADKVETRFLESHDLSVSVHGTVDQDVLARQGLGLELIQVTAHLR